MKDLGELLKGLTRPIVTIIFSAVIAQVVVEQIPISEAIWAVLTVPILWYFSDRTVQHIKGQKKTDDEDDDYENTEISL